jgi:hypothetical protein
MYAHSGCSARTGHDPDASPALKQLLRRALRCSSGDGGGVTPCVVVLREVEELFPAAAAQVPVCPCLCYDFSLLQFASVCFSHLRKPAAPIFHNSVSPP